MRSNVFVWAVVFGFFCSADGLAVRLPPPRMKEKTKSPWQAAHHSDPRPARGPRADFGHLGLGEGLREHGEPPEQASV